MFSNIIGAIGLIVSVFPIIASSLGISRLRTAISAHSSALSFIHEDELRSGYRSYIEDLSHELAARTAVSAGGPVSTLFWFAGLLLFLLVQARNAVAGAISAGASEKEAWKLLLTDGGLESTVFITSVVIIGTANCFMQARVSLLRALYLNARAPGTQAFKRLVRMGKVYSLLIILPPLAAQGAYITGIDVVRETFRMAAPEASWAWFGVVILFVPSCGMWTSTYFPLSTMFSNIRGLKTLQIENVEAKYRLSGLASSASTTPRLCAATFVEALRSPRVDLFSTNGPEGDTSCAQ